ncbi:MAG: hypothetical protein ABR585_07240 [Gemmatimonadaceae bacterium]
MATGPEHYREAEELMEKAAGSHLPQYEAYVTRAQVHATLALAAATALSQRDTMRAVDSHPWEDAASEWKNG